MRNGCCHGLAAERAVLRTKAEIVKLLVGLVIMALVSTFMATPLIRWLMKGQELPVVPVPGA